MDGAKAEIFSVKMVWPFSIIILTAAFLMTVDSNTQARNAAYKEHFLKYVAP